MFLEFGLAGGAWAIDSDLGLIRALHVKYIIKRIWGFACGN